MKSIKVLFKHIVDVFLIELNFYFIPFSVYKKSSKLIVMQLNFFHDTEVGIIYSKKIQSRWRCKRFFTFVNCIGCRTVEFNSRKKYMN